ncbi:HEAT repeat domain-containing protein [Winogradskyella sp.]|uniref:HEAT repeat domain-containing protein n=1 Tax=Winogradskyella sp. TaxID=1883156 RepID=UPI003BABFE8E
MEQVGQASSVPILLGAIDDNIHKVSIAALNALEAIGYDEELIISITRKRFHWVEKICSKEAKQKEKTEKKYNIYRWERSSKKSFEMVKERLKRPIR